MTRPVAALLAALVVAVVALAAVLALSVQQQRETDRELSRLAECVSILERNQGMPVDEPIMRCPIYN